MCDQTISFEQGLLSLGDFTLSRPLVLRAEKLVLHGLGCLPIKRFIVSPSFQYVYALSNFRWSVYDWALVGVAFVSKRFTLEIICSKSVVAFFHACL